MTHNQEAYNHYIALCIANGIAPLSFEGWSALINGEVPEEALL